MIFLLRCWGMALFKFNTANMSASLILIACIFSLNKTADSFFPFPISILLLCISSALLLGPIPKRSLKRYIFFVAGVLFFACLHFVSGHFPKLDRLVILLTISLCAFIVFTLQERKFQTFLLQIRSLLNIFLVFNLIFGVLQFIGLLEPFSFSKSHMHGFGRLSSVDRNSFLFSEPSYNVVFSLCSYFLIMESNRVFGDISQSKKITLSLILIGILLSTLSITGIIGIAIVIFYASELRPIRAFSFITGASILVLVLSELQAMSAVWARITFLLANPASDPRIFDHLISFSCDRRPLEWVFGFGYGNWYEKMQLCSSTIVHKTSNSLWADYLIETGILGVGSILAVYLMIFRGTKLSLAILAVNFFFQIHLSAVGLLAFIAARNSWSKCSTKNSA